ncbi:MAG: hypothetical protein ACYDAG_01520 [Chloroflexota bacterium]
MDSGPGDALSSSPIPITQLRAMLGRLSSLNQTLAQWDEREAQVAASGHSLVPSPALDRRAAKCSLIMLMADISRLEQEMSGRSVRDLN